MLSNSCYSAAMALMRSGILAIRYFTRSTIDNIYCNMEGEDLFYKSRIILIIELNPKAGV